jgi:hypothetical protein
VLCKTIAAVALGTGVMAPLVLFGTVASAGTTAGVTVAGGNGRGSAANQFDGPSGMVIDGSGNIYIADTFNNRVQEWAPGATAGVTVAGGNGAGSGTNQLDQSGAVFVDSAGDVYVADAGNNRVQEWAPGATVGVTVAGGNGAGSGASQLHQPTGVFVDSSGDVYVADAFNNRVQEWAPGATMGVTVAGGNGSGSAANQLGLPASVFLDGAGDVYVADAGNDRVQEWAPGAITGVTVAGGNGSGSAANQLTFPPDVFVDGTGDVYVSDYFNNRVQEWAPGATTGVTVAGGNGQGSAANQLNTPGGVWVDGSGNVYVVDTQNDRVQEWETGPGGAPLVTVDPQNQAVVPSSNVSFTAGAIGKPLPTVQWQQSIDGGATWSDIPGATSSTYTITGAPLSDNGDEFRAVFTNGAGSGTTDGATLAVTPPPTTSMLVPSNGATLSGTTYLDAAASGTVNVTKVQFELNGGTYNDTVIATATSTVDGWLAPWNTTTVPNGTYTLQSVATDADAHPTTGAPISITVNNSPPTTSVLIPPGGATMSGGSALLDASASANVSSVFFELSGGPDNDTQIATATPTFYGWLARWNTTTVPNGTYTLQSVASYKGGVSGTSPPITITVNNSPPTTSVLIPAGGATMRTSQVLDASASANVTSVVFELTGGSYNDTTIATANLTLVGWLAQWDTLSVPIGNYTLQSVASYANGVSTASAPVAITVVPPPSTVLLPANGATLDTANNVVFDAVASPGVTQVSFQTTANGFTETFTATPTIYGWIYVLPGGPPPSGYVALSFPISIESVASDPDGIVGTSAPVNGTIIVYVPPYFLF